MSCKKCVTTACKTKKNVKMTKYNRDTILTSTVFFQVSQHKDNRLRAIFTSTSNWY